MDYLSPCYGKFFVGRNLTFLIPSIVPPQGDFITWSTLYHAAGIEGYLFTSKDGWETFLSYLEKCITKKESPKKIPEVVVSIVLDPPRVLSYNILKSIYGVAEIYGYVDRFPTFSKVTTELRRKIDAINQKSELEFSSSIEFDSSFDDDYLNSYSTP